MYIDKITIAVERMEETEKFYSNFLDIEFNEIDCGDFNMYIGQIGDIQLLLCPKFIAEISAIENTIQLRFVTEDIKSTHETALRSGGTELNAIQEIDDVFTSAIRDPDGNSIELIQK